ncbi:transglycosylase domain-containing protein [Verrucosispora sp. WMMA2121]|uniref:transglycosylase domain-containing protein n=1 Tax=Verrucosispora sp. WMMA2121 TaxID=3015164 RepID=UPI0022B74213|nr:transglycosylase domain-containing protein [Verrucosispora sp. WMMA2121]MCZ7423897.1 transglycosylase domain-containing protein [Verrucosispora sp. WMMA2121]
MATPTPLSRLFTVVLTGVLAGLVLAVAALPGNLLLGFAAKAALGNYAALPDALRTPATPQRSYLYANDGKTLITTFYDVNRTDVALTEIAPVMRQAIVAAEDRRFYDHGGVDLRGMMRAVVSNVTEGSGQGGSTLTMQYVRNVLKTDPNRTAAERAAATEPTIGRKLQEIRYANALEQRLGKDEILNRYLNIAYFGSGAYGVAAASQRYFSKAAADLTLAEAALLAGLVQSPEAYSPIDGDADAALERRGYVLDSMVETGAITAEQAAEARAEKLTLDPSEQANGCAATAGGRDDEWGFFCDYLRRWWVAQPEFGDTVQEREQALRRGGYTVVTTLDPQIQATAQRQATGIYGYDNPRAVPIAAVEPGTGRVLAMAVNRHYSLDGNPDGQVNYPNTVNPLISGGAGVAGYQAGSTFKLFTMLAALESGRTLSTGFDAPSRLPTRYAAEGEGSCDGRWCPANANPEWMDGYRMMWDGFGRSVNTYFVWLAEQVGPEKVVEMAQRLGITFRAESDADFAENDAADWGAFTLGVAATTPLDLANAYATVAAEGTYCAPLPVVSVTGPDGQRLPVGDPDCREVLDADVARAATDAARCPVGQQSAFGQCNGGTATAVNRILDGRPVAGKTGSSDQAATESFVGYTPQVAVAGIAANPDDPTDHVGAAVQARVIDAVARIIATAVEGQPEQSFTPPTRELVGDPRRPVDRDPPTEPRRTDDDPLSDLRRWFQNRTRG